MRLEPAWEQVVVLIRARRAQVRRSAYQRDPGDARDHKHALLRQGAHETRGKPFARRPSTGLASWRTRSCMPPRTRRDLVVGAAARAAISNQTVFPRLLEPVLERVDFEVHYTDEPNPRKPQTTSSNR